MKPKKGRVGRLTANELSASATSEAHHDNGVETAAPKEAQAELSSAPAGHLAPADKQFLEDRETVIASGLRNFMEVGRALLDIRDHAGGRLWKGQYGTFENYCREKWGIERQHAYRLMDAAEVTGDLNLSPIGDNLPGPVREAQVRSLALLARPDDRRSAWAKAVKSHGTEPSGRAVSGIVRQMIKGGAKARSAPRATKNGNTAAPGANLTKNGRGATKAMSDIGASKRAEDPGGSGDDAFDAEVPGPQDAEKPTARTGGRSTMEGIVEASVTLREMIGITWGPGISLTLAQSRELHETEKALRKFRELMGGVEGKALSDADSGRRG